MDVSIFGYSSAPTVPEFATNNYYLKHDKIPVAPLVHPTSGTGTYLLIGH